MNCIIYSKKCKLCDDKTKKNYETKCNNCPKNYEGSSKSMEPNAALELLKDCWNQGFCIKNIVCDDDSSSLQTPLIESKYVQNVSS